MQRGGASQPSPGLPRLQELGFGGNGIQLAQAGVGAGVRNGARCKCECKLHQGDDELFPSLYCYDCSANICTQCRAAHSRFPKMSNHAIVRREEVDRDVLRRTLHVVDQDTLLRTPQVSQPAQEHRVRQDSARDGAGKWATVDAARSASQAGRRFRELTGGLLGGAMGFGRGQKQGQAWGALVVMQRHGHPSRDEMGPGVTMRKAGADSSGIVAISCGKGVSYAFVAAVEAASLGREYMQTAQKQQLVEVSVDDLHDEDTWRLCCGRGGDAWVAASVRDLQHALVVFRRAWKLAVAANSETPGSLGWGTSVLVALHREGRLAGQGSALVCLFDGTSAGNFAAASCRTFAGRCGLARQHWLHRGHFPKSEDGSHALLHYVRTDQDVKNLLKEMTAPHLKKSSEASEASNPAVNRKRKASGQSEAPDVRPSRPGTLDVVARERSGAARDASTGCGTDAQAREDLQQAGINQAFHDLLLTAGLDLDTLDKVADRDMYLDSLLKDAGVARPGDRVKIFDALRKRAQSHRPLGF